MSKFKKVLIQTGKAVSLNEVARQIGYVLEQRGIVTHLNRHTPTLPYYNEFVDAVIFVYPCAPAWCIQWFYHYVKAKRELNGRAVYYTTIEGIPKRQMIPDWVYRDVEFIANSNYTKQCLRKVGLPVIDVIPHGVLEIEIKQANELSEKYEKLIRSEFKDKVIFGFVGDMNFRKGWDKLLKAIEMLRERTKEFQVLFITKKEILKYIQNIPSTSLVSEFGIRSHVEIMGFLKAIDFLVFPSHAEGFGLPVLEANAVGTPAIICNLPVFREYADLNSNVVFDYVDVQYFDNQDGVMYEMYMYKVEDLKSALEYAIDIKKNYPSMYEEMKVKVSEKVKNFRSENLYVKFINYLNLS